MIPLLLLLSTALQADELVRRALSEEDRDQRQATVAQLRRLEFAGVEKAVRNPSRGPARTELGKVVERRAKSDLDGEEFTYAIHLPTGYDSARPWPLLVTLHGANPGGNPAAGTDWIRAWLRTAGAREGYVLLAPTTVRHTWAARQGHAYVLTSVREAMDELAIDPDRIYLDGMSMGAGGAFRLAEHHPDRWAAIGPRCNVPDLRQKSDKTFVTMLAENFRNVPVYWVVGAKDEKIPIEFARAAKSALEAARGELVYREFPEGGHDWNLERDETVLEWYARHRRATYPEEIVWKSYEKIFARAYWVEVTKRTDPPPLVTIHLDMAGKESERRTELRPPAVVRARRTGHLLDITTEEVREMRVFLDDAMMDLDQPVQITLNGRKVHDGIVKRSVDVLIEEARRRRDWAMTFSAMVELKVR
jgi:dienelactone hydrolase